MYEKREDFRFSFYAFPQLGSTIIVSRNADISRSLTGIKFAPVKDGAIEDPVYTVDICGKYTEPIYCSYDGYVDGFTINFNPLGINYFFDTPYKKLAPKNFQKSSSPQWLKFTRELFELNDFESKVAFAENFFESVFNDIRLPDIENAVNVLLKDPAIPIDTLARMCCMSARNLRRKFIQYVGCSTTTYKRIIRFRRSIDFNVWQKQKLNCTDICYTNNFFDSSHLRKEFLKLTHQNPKDFFKTISAVGDHKFPHKLV